MDYRRRRVLGLVALGAVGVGAAYRFWPSPRLSFAPVISPSGYRRLIADGGVTSGGFDPLSGVEGEQVAGSQLSKTALCRETFQGVASGPGALAVAVFSDYFCPYCRELDRLVRKVVSDMPGATLIAHQVPLLGKPSQLAARAVIAAQQLGAYEAFHKRLIQTQFVPNPAYLSQAAVEAGLDPAAFQVAMKAPETADALARSMQVFRSFGFVGVPALVIGKTLINGKISRAQLQTLMQLERGAGPSPGCSVG